jgi:hypothetical protein
MASVVSELWREERGPRHRRLRSHVGGDSGDCCWDPEVDRLEREQRIFECG